MSKKHKTTDGDLHKVRERLVMIYENNFSNPKRTTDKDLRRAREKAFEELEKKKNMTD